MLDKKRVREAEENVKSYLEEGLLKRAGLTDRNILNVFRKNSEESLRIADLLFRGNLSSLWAVVCSYYAMYYMANAVLYSLGYRVGHRISHRITSDALIVFVRGRLKERLLEDFEEARSEALELAGARADGIVESFDFERLKRSRFQYSMTEAVKRGKARTSLERAKEFSLEMEKLLM
jgi:uncharacterized protein (UPF0332 family)